MRATLAYVRLRPDCYARGVTNRLGLRAGYKRAGPQRAAERKGTKYINWENRDCRLLPSKLQFRMVQKADYFEREQFPPSNVQVQVLVEDPTGNYIMPFNCFYREGKWVGAGAGKPLEVRVLGWRLPQPPSFKRQR